MRHESTFAAGREFILGEGRVLERRLFATLFERAPADGVIAALNAYRNSDGGFGHGLEPDKLCPASLAIDVDLAFNVMDAAGCPDGALIEAACDFLSTISTGGAVPAASAAIEGYPRARHWTDWAYVPGFVPTAGLAGLLHRFGIDHEWRRESTDWCWTALEAGLPDDAHALAGVLVFVENVDEAERATRIAERVPAHLDHVSYLRLDAQDPAYGLTPLHFAPDPASPWRKLFGDDMVEAHLDRLEADQQADGGWSLAWEPPSRAATLAYRGIETLRALRVLSAYGRITPPS